MFWKKKKQKTESTSPVSTSHNNPHFDKDKPSAYIVCMSCKDPLWSMLVRVVQGSIVSTKMVPVGKNTKFFKEKDYACPLCKRPYMIAPRRKGDNPQFLLRSISTGKSFTV